MPTLERKRTAGLPAPAVIVPAECSCEKGQSTCSPRIQSRLEHFHNEVSLALGFSLDLSNSNGQTSRLVAVIQSYLVENSRLR